MTSLAIVRDGAYLSIGRLEFFMDRCSFAWKRGDMPVVVSRGARKVEVTVFTWNLCICHPKL